MSIKLGSSATKSGGGFKKGGFKNAFGPADGQDIKDGPQENVEVSLPAAEDADSDVTDQEDYYDPMKPTGCHPNCTGRRPSIKST